MDWRFSWAITVFAMEYGNGSTEAYVYVLSEHAIEYKAHFMPSFAYESYHGGSDWIHLRHEEPLEITME